MKNYGVELILDLHYCDPSTFTRKSIKGYFGGLCGVINMEKGELYWWDDLYVSEEERETEPHLVGTSAIQFIKTSNITIHTLDILKRVYLNIFSCKDFDSGEAVLFSCIWFKGQVVRKAIIPRQ